MLNLRHSRRTALAAAVAEVGAAVRNQAQPVGGFGGDDIADRQPAVEDERQRMARRQLHVDDDVAVAEREGNPRGRAGCARRRGWREQCTQCRKQSKQSGYLRCRVIRFHEASLCRFDDPAA
jgi:hypothetical protein